MNNINVVICKYINEKWIGEMSNRAFANEHDIDEKTVRQIKDIKNKSYSIKIETLEKICTAKGVSLSDFFKLIGK